MKKHIAILAVFAIASTAAARTIHLDPNAAGDYPTIQAAIDNANNCDTVVLTPGIYTGDGNRDIDFLGKAITVRSIDHNDPCIVAQTIIDCNGTQNEPHRGFYLHNGEGSDSVIAGLTITRGFNPFLPSPMPASGHAIACNGASPTITNCTITSCGRENLSEEWSQAIFAYDSNVIITNCRITDNQSNGIALFDSDITVTDSLISNNIIGVKLGYEREDEIKSTADINNCDIIGNQLAIKAFASDVNIVKTAIIGSASVHQSAGIYAERNSNLRLLDCTIKDNQAHFVGQFGDPDLIGNYGGAIIVYDGTALLQRCDISNNVARQWGGAIYSHWADVDIRDCNITNNTAGTNDEEANGIIGKGGGIYCYSGQLSIENSRVQQNKCEKWRPELTALTIGGAIFIYDAQVDIQSSKITNNNAEQGGGMYIDMHILSDYDVNVINTLIAENIALDSGSAIYQKRGNTKFVNCTLAGNNQGINGTPIMLLGGTTTITNSILWDKPGGQIPGAGGADIISYSDIRGGSTQWWGTNNIDQDPLFAADDNYRLTAGSPCIDSGTNDPGVVLPPTDLDGIPRPTDGDADGLAVTDMGAYEFDPNHLVLAAGPKLISFTYDALDDPPQKTLSICSASGSSIDFQITGTADWLDISSTTGTATAEKTEIILTADGNGLPIGSYECSFVVADTEGLLAPTTINVTLHIGKVLLVPDDSYLIQYAIDEANDYDIVLVADGNYTGQGNWDLDFKGKKIIVRSQNGPENCIIDCNENPWGYPKHYGFYFHSGETTDSVLKGFTIKNGRGVDMDYYSNGGAIACVASSPTITQCRIEDNYAWYGGGIYCYRSSAVISDCIISGNQASGFPGHGGGICCDNSGVKILNCTLSANKARYSAGIFMYAGDSLVDGCQIIDNEANFDNGGAMINAGTIKNSLIKGNIVSSNAGGVSLNGTGKLINCTITENIAKKTGGIECRGAVTLENCLVTANTAEQYGGAIACLEGGGGFPPIPIYDPAIINNCTVVGNFSLTDCNGLWVDWGAPPPRITNSIFRNGGEEIYGNVEVTYSNIEGGFTGQGNIDTDPCFLDPGYWADANDFNLIIEPSHPNAVWVDGDYHLLPESLCIDAGDPNYVPAPGQTDLDGNPRVLDGDNDGKAVVDMGAYEYVPPLEAKVRFTPRVLNLRSRGRFVLCVIRLPEDYCVADIDRTSILLQDQIEPRRFFISEKSRVALAFFNRADLQAILHPVKVGLRITGRLTDGQLFEGFDSIRVIDPPSRPGWLRFRH